jgi:predicted molibdopterin-dependent oxidoreductase YjgC
LARGGLGTGNLDAALRAPYQAMVSGLQHAGVDLDHRNALAELSLADVILLVEGDVAGSHPQVAFSIMRAVRQGGLLATWGLGTQMSRLARWHQPFLPGDGPRLVADLTSARVALAAGGSGEGTMAFQALEAFEVAQRPAIVLAPCGTEEEGYALARAFGSLAGARTGRARPVVLPLPTRANTRGALEMGVAPDLLPGPAALNDDAALRRLRDAWGCEVANDAGLAAEEMIREVRGLVVVADDPPVGLAAGAVARQALREMDCLVVLDAFLTPTAEAAHVVLPIASLAETLGTVTNLEGRPQQLGVGASPPGDARPGWRVLSDLAVALGLRPAGTLEGVRSAMEHALPMGPGSRWAGAPRLPAAPAPGKDDAHPFRLVRAGSFEWGDDPLVDFSPTLRRGPVSFRRRFPQGLVEMNAADAGRLGVREGWRVKIASARGEALVPVSMRPDLEEGVVLVPFGCRDQLAGALGGDVAAAVRVERT